MDPPVDLLRAVVVVALDVVMVAFYVVRELCNALIALGQQRLSVPL